MAGGNDDGVISRVIVHRIDVGPIASRTGADNVAEVPFLIKLLQIARRKCLAGKLRINVEAYCTLIQCLDGGIAIRIQNIPQAPFVNNIAVAVNFNDHVAHCTNVTSVRTLEV